MKASIKAIERPRVVMMVTFLVVAMALLAAVMIPVQRTPAITKAVVMVAVPYPSASPTEVEEQITRKIEEALKRLSDVDIISSTSMRGSSITQILFLDGVDADDARGEVQDLVEQVRRELPLGREIQPVVTDIDFESAPIILVNMTGPAGFDERELKQIAEEVEEDLQEIEGVANTQLFGGREREIHIDLNLDLMTEHGVSMDDVRRAVSTSHAPIPGGVLDTGNVNANIRNDTQLRSVEDVQAISLRGNGGHLLRLDDIATVSDTYRRLVNVAQLDGNNCATIIVNKKADINSLATAKMVRQRVEELAQQYPNLKFSTSRDTSQEISLMFRVLGSSFAFGAMLVLVILSWSLGLRISVLVLLAVPLSSAVGLCFLYFFDIPISNMVIFSFILVLGMVVDGAIIVAENIHRHIERGEDPVMAAQLGIEEVGKPVIMADLTTVAAYLPMLLVPDIMGDFMSVMPKVVAASLLGSVLVDHFLIPTLAARWYRKQEPKKNEEAAIVEVVEAASAVATEDVDVGSPGPTIQRRLRAGLGPLSMLYLFTLKWSLKHRWAVFASAILAVVWAQQMLGHVGFTFFPPSDRGQFEIKYELPLGSSIEQSILAAELLSEPLDSLREKVNYVAAIGSSEGLASRLETDPAIGPEFGTIMVQLTSPLDRDRHEDAVIAELRQRLDINARKMPGLEYVIREVEEGPPGGYKVAVRVSGDDLHHLGRTVDDIADRLAEMDNTVDVGTDYRDESPQIEILPDPGLAGLNQINPTQVAGAVQTAISGDTSILLSLGDEDVTLRTQASLEYQQSPQQLGRLMVIGQNGQRIPVTELAEIERVVGLYGVNHYSHSRSAMAYSNVQGKTKPDEIFEELREEILPAMNFEPVERGQSNGNSSLINRVLEMIGIETAVKPTSFVGKAGTSVEGLRATFTGENEERDDNFGYMLRSMLIAAALIFAILVFQFNSFRQSTLVMLTVPLSFVGVVAGLWLCEFPFSLAAFIGLVSLTGVVVNDAIVLVDFINQARKRGLPIDEAILEAGVNRMRPVMLTTLTTIGGLLPLFLNLTGGAEFWQPLTGAVIFGLGFATMLTLIVIPVAYGWIYRKKAADYVSWYGRLARLKDQLFRMMSKLGKRQAKQ